MVDISVIIVSWNAKKHLINCLNSNINNQAKYKYSHELIVIDNDSTDGSPEAVEKEFPQVKLIRNQQNLGFAKANNIGISACSGRYICLMNSDIIILNDCLESLKKYMDQYTNVGMTGPRFLNSDNILLYSCRNFPSLWNNLCLALALNRLFPKSSFFSDSLMRYWKHNSIRKVDVLPGCLWLVRRNALEQVGLLDERYFIYGEDVDWCKRFHEQGWDVVFYPEAEAIHYHGASSANDPIRFTQEMIRSNLQYWEKHHCRISNACYILIMLLRYWLRFVAKSIQFTLHPTKKKSIVFKLKQNLSCIQFILHRIFISNRTYGKTKLNN